MSEKHPVSSDAVGTLAAALQELQSPQQVLFELVQNADDAKSHSIRIELTDEHLRIENDSDFQFCENWPDRVCTQSRDEPQSNRRFCDLHAVVTLNSQNKHSDNSSTGRFGIGFAVVYQVSDAPVLQSGCWKVEFELIDDTGRHGPSYTCTTVDQGLRGSSLTLPWRREIQAKHSRFSALRHWSEDSIEQFEIDIRNLIPQSLLFLRNVTCIELSSSQGLSRHERNQMELNVNGFQDLMITSEGMGEHEIKRYLVYRTSVAMDSAFVFQNYKALLGDGAKEQPGVEVEIPFEAALPLGEEETDGYFFQFLPTQHKTGVGLHINGPFLLQVDRLRLQLEDKFELHSTTAIRWNQALVERIAGSLCDLFEALSATTSSEVVVKIIDKSRKQSRLSLKESTGSMFWNKFQSSAPHKKIYQTVRREAVSMDSRVYVCRLNQVTISEQLADLLKINLVSEPLRKFRDTLIHLGAKELDQNAWLAAIEGLAKSELNA